MLNNDKGLQKSLMTAPFKAVWLLFNSLFLLVQTLYALIAILSLYLACALSASAFIRIKALTAASFCWPACALSQVIPVVQCKIATQETPVQEVPARNDLSAQVLPAAMILSASLLQRLLFQRSLFQQIVSQRIAQKTASFAPYCPLSTGSGSSTDQSNNATGQSYHPSGLSQVCRYSTA